LHGIGAREPWIFGEPYQQIAKHWLNLRYRMLPYLQGVIANAVQNSLPVAQAMPLAFPEDTVSWAYEHQYLFGPALLVRPIITASDRVLVWLPKGSRWFDFWSTDVYEGGQLIEIKAGLDRIPVFGREGHVLALGPEVETTAQINPQQPINELWLFGKTTEQPLVMNNVISLEAAGVINVDSGTVLRLRSWGSSWTRKADSLRYDDKEIK
jgi:alpha-D-xyloside xylohydrolase